MRTISIIAAISENDAIGKDQQLLCHMPTDMKRFKALTTGHAVIMGRKTFESLPHPLPNRQNIILTTASEAVYAGCFACPSMEAALELCEPGAEVFIIGGAQIYGLAIDLADKMYITRIHHTFEDATTFFPEVDWNQWEEVERDEHPADAKNPYPFTFLTYVRRK